jgi:hypothetical protein
MNVFGNDFAGQMASTFHCIQANSGIIMPTRFESFERRPNKFTRDAKSLVLTEVTPEMICAPDSSIISSRLPNFIPSTAGFHLLSQPDSILSIAELVAADCRIASPRLLQSADDENISISAMTIDDFLVL